MEGEGMTLLDCCSNSEISVYILNQYRPKEFLVKCHNCETFVTGKGLTKTAIKTWNALITRIKNET